MRKLDRAIAAAPPCLSAYDYRTQSWGDLDRQCTRQLRHALFQMQGIAGITSADAGEYGLRCAYCEGPIYNEGHIEHFRRKNPDHFPELTFDWDNLFLACGAHSHCGHFKDRKDAPPYNPDRLVKPDEHDPEHYFYFHSTGEVRVRTGLVESDAHRAAETIKVFGLNDSSLAGARKNSIAKHRQRILSALEVIETWPDDDRNDYFIEEIEASRWEPFATTLKHFMQANA